MTGPLSSIFPGKRAQDLIYEMWDDGSRHFRRTVRLMKELGYQVRIISIEHEHQQNQYIGTKTKFPG